MKLRVIAARFTPETFTKLETYAKGHHIGLSTAIRILVHKALQQKDPIP